MAAVKVTLPHLGIEITTPSLIFYTLSFAWYTSTQIHIISRSYLSVQMFQMQNQWLGFDIHENWNGSTLHTSNGNLSPSEGSGRRNVRILVLRRNICYHSSDPNATSEMKIRLQIQINQQPDATIFQFIILKFIYSSTCFGRFSAIIRSSMTAVAAYGFTFVSWWESCCVLGRVRIINWKTVASGWWFIWIVRWCTDLQTLNCTMMHGLTNLKLYDDARTYKP